MKKRRRFLKIEIIMSLLAVFVSIIGSIGALLIFLDIGSGTILYTFVALISALSGLALGYLYGTIRRPKRLATIYISHALADIELARKLTQDLRQDGYTILLSEEDITIGDNIAAKVKDSIAKADFLVAILSRQAIQSEWVFKELAIAQE